MKSDIKFVLNELLTLNMLDNSEKLLNFASNNSYSLNRCIIVV